MGSITLVIDRQGFAVDGLDLEVHPVDIGQGILGDDLLHGAEFCDFSVLKRADIVGIEGGIVDLVQHQDHGLAQLVAEPLGVGHALLGGAVGAHNTPLIVVARKPYLREVAETVVGSHILGVEVAVIVDDGHFCRVVVVQSLGRRALQQEIRVVKLFHGFGF